jgi:hypothetical protein
MTPAFRQTKKKEPFKEPKNISVSHTDMRSSFKVSSGIGLVPLRKEM